MHLSPVLWFDTRRLSLFGSGDFGQRVLMPPSKGLFRKILSPLMWRRNYHPLSEDKLEESLNDAERRDPSTILFFIFF